MNHIYTSVDIGSDTIKIVVCELIHNKLNLLSATSIRSNGIKKGLITDVNAALASLKEAFTSVENMLGISINQVMVCVPSYFADFKIVDGSLDIKDVEAIGGNEITKIFANAMKPHMNSSIEMVTVLPIDFTIDGRSGIKDPKGMSGEKLEVKAVLVTTPKKNIYSVVNLLDNIGVDVVDISITGLGDLYMFKDRLIDEGTGAIVNIGAETTTVSLYNKGIIVKNSVLQMGGKNIDHDLAYMFNIDEKQAKKMKEKFALANKRYASTSEYYEISAEKKINQYEASEVVQARIIEILSLAKKEISILSNKNMDYIIFTGGVSNMEHFNYTIQEIINNQASIGNIKLLGVRNNRYSSAIGNILYFISKLRLKGIDYTMVSDNDFTNIRSKNNINISNSSMLRRVFNYFFDE